MTNHADLNCNFLLSFGPFSPFMWSEGVENRIRRCLESQDLGIVAAKRICKHCTHWLRCSQAHLYDSGRGNMPGHVGSPGRSDPERWWNILSSGPRTNSSWRLNGRKGCCCLKKTSTLFPARSEYCVIIINRTGPPEFVCPAHPLLLLLRVFFLAAAQAFLGVVTAPLCLNWVTYFD